MYNSGAKRAARGRSHGYRVPGAAQHEPTGRREAPPDDRLRE
jgi:hypothetical protein